MDEDYDFDDDDYGWLYAEDDFDLADELAENQLPDPGYSGTNFEIAMESYEFELYAFWEDLEYADDAYWDYGLSVKDDSSAGIKRKRETGKKAGITDKRRRTQPKTETYDREEDPLIFISQADRIRSFFEPPPMLKTPVKSSFLADWRERFAHDDGFVESKVMPGDMKRAAEAKTLETPPKVKAAEVTAVDGEEEEEGDWEDDEDEDEEGDEDADRPGLDQDMLKEILKQKLGDVGLPGEDEAAFMQVISKMMNGGDTDDAAEELTTTLLEKLGSGNGGDSALSGWLSRQGVELEGDDDDDAASVATVDLPEGLRHRGLSTQQRAQDSPIDSVVGGEAQKRTSSQMPLLPGSPTNISPSAKKRTATTMDENEKPSKKQKKKVTFDVPSSSSSDPPAQAASDLPTSEDPLMSETTVRRPPAKAEAQVQVPKEAPATRISRKRKATSTEVAEEKPPEKKKTRKKEVEALELVAVASPMGPPARRTRAAKAKAGK